MIERIRAKPNRSASQSVRSAASGAKLCEDVAALRAAVEMLADALRTGRFSMDCFPYVLWQLADGREVLVRRSFSPLIIRHPDGRFESVRDTATTDLAKTEEFLRDWVEDMLGTRSWRGRVFAERRRVFAERSNWERDLSEIVEEPSDAR
jgi:hypothetical protein